MKIWRHMRERIIAAGLTAIVATALIFLEPATCRAGERWVEDSFEDFADGKLDAAGQNLYAARDGTVRTIHRFDLNDDGHIDLIFNSTHDIRTSLPATLATVSANGTTKTSPLAVEGSRHLAMADFNRDCFLDIVFCPNRSGAQQGRRFLTILWGGKDGWPAHRSNGALPVHNARKVAVVDLNADGWPDIAVLNGPGWLRGQPEGDIVRVYWGSSNGFLLTDRTDFGVQRAVDFAAHDFDGDGSADLAILTGKPDVEIVWAHKSMRSFQQIDRVRIDLNGVPGNCVSAADMNADGHADLLVGTSRQSLLVLYGSAGKAWQELQSVRAANATHVASGDLDNDGHVDVVLTNFAAQQAAGGEAVAAGQAGSLLVVLWGKEGGLSAAGATQIPIAHATETAIGDLNADGKQDIAASVYQGATSFTADSVIFFGRGERKFQRSRDPLQTVGAAAVAIAPAKGELPARAVFSNSVGGTLKEQVPLQVFWGGEGGFDAKNVWTIPFASGYESSAADLNRDGYVDLIALNSGHAGAVSATDPTLGINIFWGGKDGFELKQGRTVLREENLGTSNVADLNRDGFLDLVVGQFSRSKTATETQLIIYYGGKNGFDSKRRAAIPSPGRSISSVVADFNGDEWLDVAVNSFLKDRVRLFWGGPDGFDQQRQLELSIHSPIDMETADLNGDGHQDLIVGSYEDGVTKSRDLGTHIFWGSGTGLKKWNAQWLPGFTPIGHCVADFDGDGHLDLFSPHYHANGTRESLPCYLFWGGPNGFSTSRRTELICDSAHDALAADFNRDGKLDLAVVCHARNGTHHTVSRIFYNDGKRFRKPRIKTLPTHGPHWMWQQDMGHVANRSWRQQYESSILSFDDPMRRGRMTAKVVRPDGTRIEFAVRTAETKQKLANSLWQKTGAAKFKINAGDRFLQYSATFHSDNGDRYPILDRVEIELE